MVIANHSVFLKGNLNTLIHNICADREASSLHAEAIAWAELSMKIISNDDNISICESCTNLEIDLF